MLLQHPPRLGIDMEAPSPHPYGILAQGLSLTMRPIRTASPHWRFFPLSPETLLSSGSRANFLNFQNFGQIYTQGNRAALQESLCAFLGAIASSHYAFPGSLKCYSFVFAPPPTWTGGNARETFEFPASRLSRLAARSGSGAGRRSKRQMTFHTNFHYAVVVWGFFRTRGKTTPAHSKVSSVLVVALYS